MRSHAHRIATLMLALGATWADVASAAEEMFRGLPRQVTLITPTGFGNASQSLTGFWWLGLRGGKELDQIAMPEGAWVLLHRGGEARVDASIRTDARHRYDEGVPGIRGQFKRNGSCLTGLVRTSETLPPDTPARCPGYYWWTRAQVCLNPDMTGGDLETAGFMHDEATCERDPARPITSTYRLQRYIGATFAPVWQQAYIRTLTVAAPAQFAAEAKVAWDYRMLRTLGEANVVRVALLAQGREIFSSRDLAGERAVPLQLAGRQELQFRVYDGSARVVHIDNLVAILASR